MTGRLGGFLFIFFFSFQTHALEFNEDELILRSGKNQDLAADEGYLYLSLESHDIFADVILDRVGSGKALKFEDVQQGSNHALIKLKAGTYYWKVFKYFSLKERVQFKFKEDEYHFEVKPGIINYPGTWIVDIERVDRRRASISLKNENKFSYESFYYQRSLKKHLPDHDLVYQGVTEDMYAKHLLELKQKKSFTDDEKLYYAAGNLDNVSISFFDVTQGVKEQNETYPQLKAYLENDRQSTGEINPKGTFILLNSRQQSNDVIELMDLKSFQSYVLFKRQLPDHVFITNLQWIDNNTFLYELESSEKSYMYAVHLSFDGNNQLVGADQVDFPANGIIVDRLIDQENHLLMASRGVKATRKFKLGLYKVDTTDAETMRNTLWKKYSKYKKFDIAADWLTDQSGEVRFLVEPEYDKKAEQFIAHFWFLPEKNGKKWTKIKSSQFDENVPWPILISEDEAFFYAITDNFGDKHAIHKFSTADYSHLGEFYTNTEYDIQGLKIDPSTQLLVGYVAVVDGLHKTFYFEEGNDAIKNLREKNPNLELHIAQRSLSSNNMLVFGTSRDSKGSWYLHNRESEKTVKLLDENAGYERLPKGVSHNLKITTEDGIAIEGYLVTPVNNENAPLVVVPHGGPIGVRDYAYNDEMQHFFAANGIATLKVNYRGSGGFGKEFEELGNQQWGEKIESDIHAMVQQAVQDHKLNDKKICAMGSSYGGYSAVMLTLLYPNTYQCAVSLAGVMDLPLLFMSNEFSRSEKTQEKLAEKIGDPKTDLQALVNKSPFYNVEKLSKPIKLFHGRYDSRVTMEHALRMQQAFTILGLDGSLTVLQNEGHSMRLMNSNIYYLAESLSFIKDKLSL